MEAAEVSAEAVLAGAGSYGILSKFQIVEFYLNFKIGCWYKKQHERLVVALDL